MFARADGTIDQERERRREARRRELRLLCEQEARLKQRVTQIVREADDDGDWRCQYPGCTATRELEAHHVVPVERGGTTELDNLSLLCARHHKLLHDHRIRTSGNGEHPAFTDEAGRAITAPAHIPGAATDIETAVADLPE